MAIKKTVFTPHGFTAHDAYHKVISVLIEDKTKMTFSCAAKKESVNEPFVISQHSCAYDISGGNPIAQAYAYLKTLPEFLGAVDC